ncbi:MAG: nucleotidyltransferase domain-containing protein [Fimbriimonadaceae bacterium]|nr:nucleotidyltransferase domain-containing protein [Fimbriimonadaceae bacterium]
MVSLDDATRQALEALCEKYAVRRLKIFGSAARADFDAERSDLDFLVEFGPPPVGMRLGVQFFGLHDELEGLFDRPVDLLEESAIENSRLRRSAQSGAVTLYAS